MYCWILLPLLKGRKVMALFDISTNLTFNTWNLQIRLPKVNIDSNEKI
jgi:hypothetical protein